MSKIKKILIANRSEIAIRIAKTLKKMNIESLSIYSDVDRNMPHRRFGDFNIELKGDTTEETYLNIQQIIQIAKDNNVDAIHPGYGFLSEKSYFAKTVEDAGIIFIGPNYKSIDAMGDKINSKKTAKECGVPLIPGFIGEIESEEHLYKIAEEIGFPVMIKSSAGGGGKGMRIARKKEELYDFYQITKYEALTNYKDDRLFLEKYIENPRHIEVQILGDKFGNIVALGERECSIQRFNQKIIEESPSSFVSEKLREKLYESAVKLAKSVGYYSAGTIEFVMDQAENFYFLEMNTRLQVEHRVSEFVNGNIDLVELMIKIAEGEKLPFKQKEIQLIGHAIECRICAENPYQNFIPSTGKITHYYQPNESFYNNEVKIDMGIESGSVVSSFYDAMIGKIITYASTREIAIQKMRKVLNEIEIEGIITNIDLLQSILKNESFLIGKTYTSFINTEYPNGFKFQKIENVEQLNFLAAFLIIYLKEQVNSFSNLVNKDLKYLNVQDLSVLIEDKEYKCAILNYDENSISFSYSSSEFTFKYDYFLGNRRIELFNKDLRVVIQMKKDQNIIDLKSNGLTARGFVMKEQFSHLYHILPKNIHSKSKNILSPLNGKIKKIKVKEGDVVLVGDVLFHIEAMKMENQIKAEFDCKIKKIYIKEEEVIKAKSIVIDLFSENKD